MSQLPARPGRRVKRGLNLVAALEARELLYARIISTTPDESVTTDTTPDIVITFAQDMEEATVTNLANYRLRRQTAYDDGVNIALASATYNAGNRTVTLAVSGNLSQALYKLYVTPQNIRASNGETLAPQLDLAYALNSGGTTKLEVLRRDGPLSNPFVTTGIALAGGNLKKIESGFLNGDAIRDIVAIDATLDKVWVFLGLGNGEFADGVAYDTAVDPNDLRVGDLNDDGFDEIVTANDSNSISILRNDGTGAFPAAQRIEIATANRTNDVAIADFDKDGNADLAVSIRFNPVKILYGDGTGTAFPASLDVGTGGFGLEVADMDKDGFMDVVVANQNIDVLYGQSGRAFTTLTFDPFGVAGAPRIGDVTGDGRLDIVVDQDVIEATGARSFSNTLVFRRDLFIPNLVLIDVNGAGRDTVFEAGANDTGFVGAGIDFVGNQILNAGDLRTRVAETISVNAMVAAEFEAENYLARFAVQTNQSPVINSQSFSDLPENSPNGTVAGTAIASDPDAGQTLTYAIIGGNPGGAFAINSTTGEITVANFTALDFETTPVFNLVVEVTDNGTPVVTASGVVTINLTNVNEPLTITSSNAFNLPENSTAAGMVVGLDPEIPVLTYAIDGGADSTLFAIHPLTGELSFLTAPDFELPSDANGNNVYEVTISVSNGVDPIVTQAISVTVTNVDESPVFTSGPGYNFPEETSGAIPLTAADPEFGVLQYAITGGADSALFSINTTTGALSFLTPPDFELPTDSDTNNVYEVTVTVTDGVNPAVSQNALITVQDASETPFFFGPTEFSFEEFSTRWTLIGQLQATDLQGDRLTFSIMQGNTDNTLTIGDGTVVADGGKLWVNKQDLTGLRHRGMFNLRVRVTENTPQALFSEVDIKVFITPAPRINTVVTPSSDSQVIDGDGNGFSDTDVVLNGTPTMQVQGGANPSRGVMQFNLSAMPNRTLKSAWLFFNTSHLVGGASVNVPLDLYGYAATGAVTGSTATLGSKIGSRTISNSDGSNQRKVHAVELDASFVRSLVGTGTLGLVLRNDVNADGVVIDTSESTTLPSQKPYLVLQFSDLPPDLLVRDATAGSQYLALKSNGSAFTVSSLTVFATQPAGTWQNQLTGDFNGDGLTDIAARRADTGGWWVATANPLGGFKAARDWVNFSPTTTWANFVVGDFNGDGRDDLAGRDTATGEWRVGRSVGSAFQPRVWGSWSTATTWSDVVTADFNRDGNSDIAGRNSAGEWFVALAVIPPSPYVASFNTTKWGAWSTATTWSDVRIGDFNGDGRADIAGRSSIGQWWVNRSTGSSFAAALFYGNWSTGTTWSDVRMADLNGDGRDDIVGRSAIGQWWVAECSVSNFAMKFLGTWSGPQSQWNETLVGDFNRDGRADLATRSSLTNQVWTSLSSPSGFVTSAWASLVNPTTFQWRVLRSSRLGSAT